MRLEGFLVDERTNVTDEGDLIEINRVGEVLKVIEKEGKEAIVWKALYVYNHDIFLRPSPKNPDALCDFTSKVNLRTATEEEISSYRNKLHSILANEN